VRPPDLPSDPRSPFVRFRLPVAGTQQTEMSGDYKEVSTKDAAPEVLKLGTSASKWTTQDLDLLGVDYQYDKFEEIKTPVEGMPPELMKRTVLASPI